MHSKNLTPAMRHTLRDQSRVQRHGSHPYTTHRIAFDAHAKNFTAHVRPVNPEVAAAIALEHLVPVRKRHEIHCPLCFMLHRAEAECPV